MEETRTMLSYLWRKKPITPHVDNGLHRSLNLFDLTFMGIGAIIGAGVFVLTGVAAATKAGPAISLSYVIAGLASLFAALAYAEMASSIGGSGSAYSYAYAGFGEFIAWLIGWDLLLEYIMSVSTVAIGWSGYVDNLFTSVHVHLPIAFTKGPFEGGVINLLAVTMIAILAIFLSLGVKNSARFNNVIVFIKLITIAVFITIAALNVEVKNWHPFFPFGWSGVMSGAALVFFSYIGFDALSTAVEESIHPERDIPLGIINSLLICTLVYIVVSALLTGIVSYTHLNVGSPVAFALLHIGHRTAAGFIAAGAIAGLTTVMLVMYYGLTRICLAISRDGLLPAQIATLNRETRTPLRIIIVMGIIIAIIAGIVPINHAAEMVNIGTLAAFFLVCLGTVILRITHPELHRPFKLPFNPLIPLLGAGFCLYLMLQLPAVTWWRFSAWAVLGLIIYFLYSQRHSLLK